MHHGKEAMDVGVCTQCFILWNQEVEGSKCWCPAYCLLFIHPRGQAHRMVLPTPSMSLLSVAPLWKYLGRQVSDVCLLGDSKPRQVDNED